MHILKYNNLFFFNKAHHTDLHMYVSAIFHHFFFPHRAELGFVGPNSEDSPIVPRKDL